MEGDVEGPGGEVGAGEAEVMGGGAGKGGKVWTMHGFSVFSFS